MGKLKISILQFIRHSFVEAINGNFPLDRSWID